MKASRSSNIELLRIVAMSMVVLSHFLWFGITENSIPDRVFYFLVPFVACGVNLFFMISGWFKIRCSLKSILTLALTILLFVLLNRLITIPFVDINVFNNISKVILFPISYSSYWFIKVYLFLIITSPLINLALENMSLAMLRKFTGVFLFFNVYSCAIGGNLCNDSYSYVQGALMYCLGYYLRRDYELYEKVSKKYALLISFGLLLMSGLGCAFLHLLGIFTTYNSIVLIAASFSLFYVFTKIELQSRAINFIASAALGCYLLQDGFFGWHFMYGWMHEIFISSFPAMMKILIYSGVFIATWIASMIVSPIIKAIASRTVALVERILPQSFVAIFDWK